MKSPPLTRLGLKTVLVSGLLLTACGDFSGSSPKVSPSPGSKPGTPTTSVPTPTNAPYYQNVDDSRYIDATGEIRSAAVPYAVANGSFSPQALLPECAVSTSTPSFPGAIFYRRATFPGEVRLEGVNRHRISLSGLKYNLIPAPYDAPVSKANGDYERDAQGGYVVRQAYPDVYVLGGIAGAGDKGRELYFGFRYNRSGTANSLPAFEPYVQLGDPVTGRITVANIQPVVNGQGRTLQLDPGAVKNAEFEVLTTPDKVTRIYLRLPANGYHFYNRLQTSKGVRFQRYSTDWQEERLLIWQGTIGDISSNPSSLENQLRKFELRINYGPFLKNGVVYSGKDSAAMNDFIAARTDFAQYTAQPRFGTLSVAEADAQGNISSDRPVAADIFETLPDIRQRCATARTSDGGAITLGDETQANNYQEPGSDHPLLMSSVLPSQMDVSGTTGMIVSEGINFEWHSFGQMPSPMLLYTAPPDNTNFEIGLRMPGWIDQGSESSSYAMDLLCKKDGQYNVPVSVWDQATPNDKKTANISLTCGAGAPSRSPYQTDPNPVTVSVNDPALTTVYGKVGNRVGIAVPLETSTFSSYRLSLEPLPAGLNARLNLNAGLLTKNNLFVSYPCTTAGTFNQVVNIRTDAGVQGIPVNFTCGTGDNAPLDLPVINDQSSLVAGSTTTLNLTGSVKSTVNGSLALKFQNLPYGESSTFAVLSPSDLLIEAVSGPAGQLNLNAQYNCTAPGVSTKQVLLQTQLAQNTSIPLQVKVTCQSAAPQVTPITMTAAVGTTATGTSTATGVNNTLTVNAAANLPTTSTKNTDGSYTLTSKYSCTTAGTFNPSLKVTIDGVIYTVPVTVNCTAAPTTPVTIPPITMSGSLNATLTGTTTGKPIKSSLGVKYDTTLPTTGKINAGGTFTLTSKYTCKTKGTFTPLLIATVDGVDYPVSVTVTCK